MSDSLENELDILQSRILQEYENNSILNKICKLGENPNGKRADFNWITKKEDFPKQNLVEDNVLTNTIVNNFLADETNYLIDNIRNNSTTVALDGDELNSIRRYTIDYFTEQELLAIIIPRTLWTSVPDWNRTINPQLTDNSNSVLFLGYPKKAVQVVIPPHGVEFNDIIITSIGCNRLQFIPSKEKNRADVGHEVYSNKATLYIHAWYKYEKSQLDCNVVIRRGA